ncbi:MAG: TonB-dependent receptor [Pseudomonadales bacterium]|nr:TonB-dependent receptor [Pseudomonadales bacterium]MBO6566275.1 TonB-dependent receptor [Pseudomonadales bacterium]MBO6596886.1 TonB-dependent receptor [Pseudomonadales bacterium]MBO6703557.1 TonB-dependent receptor [Pseudomonadales bacterium]MBO6823125.1 TonB-dependent receptor [Pseudomonadales bacterium]
MKRKISLALLLTSVVSTSLPVVSYAEQVIEEIVTVGTRSSKARSAADSPVPVDVISAETFEALGNTADMTDNLKALVPSYNAAPATGDGSAFVRPTSLRGTAPDQTLVLVNGKRRHRSALVQFFAPAAGNGAHGVDVGMIPSLAVKRIEVLRDGAASQYGSDAIAGVVNFVLKDASDGGQVQVQFGEYFDGEQSVRVGANGGFAIGDIGFVNATIDFVDNDALSRGIQRPNAQALIDAGVPGVGADAPFGDSPLVQTWGRPETEGVRFYLNSGFDISDAAELYARLSLAETEGRYRFFYRDPNHSSLTNHRAEGYTGLPGGFTPFLDGDQDDVSIVIGIQGEFQSGMGYDFSYNYGKNELDYFLNNTVNGDLPLVGTCPSCEISQRDFDVGGYAQEETTINLDFSYQMTDRVHLGFGFEAREETFTANAGEPNSFLGGGSSGFRGIEPANAGDFDRDNVAVYVDIEHDITDKLLLQYAARYEDFSDFGNTLNGKLAGRYRVNDSFALRGAISTGFHAPTPGQSNVSTIITTFDGTTGLQVEEGLLPVSNPAVILAGGAPLTEEESTNYSFGFTADIGDWVNLTTDFYLIEVEDRIYRTGDIPVPPQPTDPPGAPARTISFYTNALDVEHQGVDVVATSGFELGSNTTLNLSMAYAYNEIDVTDQKLIRGIQPVSDGNVEDIENNYPEHKWVLTGNFLIGESWNVMARVNYYGDHYDERGRIDAAVDPTAEIDGMYFVDLEIGWDITDNWRVVAGGSNIFDEFPDEIGPPNANRLSVGLQYPRRTVANYEGGSWYLKTVYRFGN